MDRVPEEAAAGPAAVLSRFRREFHACLTARADELAEWGCGAVRGQPGAQPGWPVVVLGHRRGHGALYDAVNCGRIEIARLRRSLAGLPFNNPDRRVAPANRAGPALNRHNTLTLADE